MRGYDLLRPLLFRMEPERAHRLAVFACSSLEKALRTARISALPYSTERLRQRLCGIEFANPVGLAAGFDKDARAPHVWPWFGFGFAELGTITRHAQPGNPRPRMFRLPREHALINRLGFNNDGAEAAAARLARATRRLAPSVPLGINIGKSKITPLDAADDDYRFSLQCLFSFADYVTINVSSPNTPGLRDLQAPAELARLITTARETCLRLAQDFDRAPCPVFVKVAPDLDDDALTRLVDVVHAKEASGLVATNTTLARPGAAADCSEAGGLSGRPLRDRADAVVRLLRRHAGPALPIIGVGGIASAADAYQRIRAGADLVQLYSAMVYEGPFVARRIARGLDDLLRRDGYARLADAVGADV